MRSTSDAGRLRPLLMALAVAAAAPAVHAQPADTLPAEVDQAVMHLVLINRTAGRFIRRGTAFHVGGGVFYTNAHVVQGKFPDGYTEWRLTSPKSTRVPDTWMGPATVSCIHSAWKAAGNEATAGPYDVAQLRVPGGALLPPALLLGPRMPQPGMWVRIKGFPEASRGWPPVLYTSLGRVDEISTTDEVFSIRIESGFAMGGSSGSPVFASDHRVVGMMFGGNGAEGRTASGESSAVTAAAIQSGCPAR